MKYARFGSVNNRLSNPLTTTAGDVLSSPAKMASDFRRYELLLFLRQTFFINHTTSERGVRRSLGCHLIAVYDTLVALGCDSETCTAGALHSIYGTSTFQNIAILASPENRELMRQRFGIRTEWLAFLFHSCHRQFPNNIETGVLRDRKNLYPIPSVTFEDIQALRLIEAANVLDQRTEVHLEKNLPNVHRLWISQLSVNSHRQSSQLTEPSSSSCCNDSNKKKRPGLWLRIFPQDGELRKGAACHCKGYDTHLPLKDIDDYWAASWTMAKIISDHTQFQNSHSHSSNEEGSDSSRSSFCNIKNGKRQAQPARAVPSYIVVFVLKGEAEMGMPWSPLWMLSRYSGRVCSSNWPRSKISWRRPPEHPLEIEVKFLKASSTDIAPQMYERLSVISRSVAQSRRGPPSIPYQSIIDGTSLHNGAASLIDSMLSYGYAVISVNDAAANTITRAYDSLLRFHSYLPAVDKKKTFQRFDGDRFIGWTRDSSREWIQMRERKHPDGTKDVPLGWPDTFPEEQRRDLTDAVQLVTATAEVIFEEIGVLLGLGSRSYLRDLSMATCRPGKYGVGSDEARVGSSVCRQFVYLDRPTPVTSLPCPRVDPPSSTPARAHPIPSSASGCHADMGIITLSPCSTIPALNLVHPATHEMLYPEVDLRPNEWILFAGESLSFLSGGTIQAPLHSVPYIDRTSLRKGVEKGMGPESMEIPPLRRSMPLFLRADPDMFLHPKRDLQWHHPAAVIPSSESDCTLSLLRSECKNDAPQEAIDKIDRMCVDSTSEVSATLRSTESSVDDVIEVQDMLSTTATATATATATKKKKIKVAVEPFVLSPYSMTCRRYTEDHSIGLRPWRLIKGSGDF